VAWIDRAIRQDSGRTAVQFKGVRFTYGDVAVVLDAFSQFVGLRTGNRVLVVLPDGLATYVIHLWAFTQGITLIPQSILASTEHLTKIRLLVAPDFVVTTRVLLGKHADAFRGLTALVVESQQVDPVRGVAVNLRWCGPESTAEPRDSADVRLIIFTSGSTGVPKGVCLGESNIRAAAGMMVDFLGLDHSRTSLATVPLYDYYGMIQIYGHLLSGAGWILGEGIAFPRQLFQRILDEPVTDLVLVPHTLRRILESGDPLAATLYGSARSSPALASSSQKECFDRRLHCIRASAYSTSMG